MSRLKLFITNFLVFGFGGIISKVIPLIMVPIITRLMPNSFYYGVTDLSNTIISLFSALAVMGMYDAMYRMFFEEDGEDYKKAICSSAFAFTLITSVMVSIIMFVFRKQISQIFYSNSNYGNMVVLSAVSVLIGSTNSIVSAPTRMQNNRTIFLMANVLSSVLSYVISISLILNGYYLIALPLANIISSTLIEIVFGVLNQKWFDFRCVQWKYIKPMLNIALPLLPNFLIYWVFNSSDRIMIANILGTDQEGVYAVAAKIGQVSQLIYTAFAGGWQFFAFSVMKDKDSVNVISKVFEIMALISFSTTLFITSVCKLGMELLFEEEYWEAYLCIPYLFLSPLLLMLFQIGTNQFLVIKKTWPNLIILSSGAVINVILNISIIPIIRIEGASIATLVGYTISIIACVVVLKRYKLININLKLIFSCVLFFVLFGVMRLNGFTTYFINIPVALLYLVYMIVINISDLKKIITGSNQEK